MQQRTHMPNFDRLSIVTAMVLLAYALTAFIHIPERTVSLQLPGFLLEFNLNLVTIVSGLVAVLAASGTDWLLSNHPEITRNNRLYHWLLPGLTAIVIGVPLDTMQPGTTWWILFGLGGILFSAVLTSEYISVDPTDERYSLAMIGLTAVALALLLILLISMRGAGFRLFLVLAAAIPAIALISARCLSLRLNGQWSLPWAGVITLITIQIAVGLYYLPLSPLRFGLLLLAVTYGLISIIAALAESQPKHMLWTEPTIMTGALILIAIMVR